MLDQAEETKAMDKLSKKKSGGSKGKAQIAAKKQILPEQSELVSYFKILHNCNNHSCWEQEDEDRAALAKDKGNGRKKGTGGNRKEKGQKEKPTQSDMVKYPDLVCLNSLTVTLQEKEMEKVPLTKSKPKSIRESRSNASRTAAEKKPNPKPAKMVNHRDDSIVWWSSFSFQLATLTWVFNAIQDNNILEDFSEDVAITKVRSGAFFLIGLSDPGSRGKGVEGVGQACQKEGHARRFLQWIKGKSDQNVNHIA